MLYILGEKYHGKQTFFFKLCVVTSATKKLLKIVADNIQNYLSNYSKELETIKSNRYSIIGYIIKSRQRAGETEGDRVRVLNLMVQRLKERDLMWKKVFASSKSDSKDTLMKRDIPRPTIICKVKGVGSTV